MRSRRRAVAGLTIQPPREVAPLSIRKQIMEDRLNHLESKLAFAEDMLEELNLTVFRQREQLDQVQQQMRLLYQQIQSGGNADKADAREDVPPHY